MAKHLSAIDIQRYRQATMSPVELLALDDHIADCVSCRERLDYTQEPETAITHLWTALSTEPADETRHLTFDALVAYLDNRTDYIERESVQDHLAVCQPCMAEMRDLRMFSSVMESPAESYLPAPATSGQKSTFLWRPPVHQIALGLAGAAAVVALFFWVAILPLRSQIAQLQQTNEALKADLERSHREAEAARQANQAALASLADLQKRIEHLQQSETETLEPGSSRGIALALNDGGAQVAMDRRGNITGLESAPREWRNAVKTVLLAQRVERPRVLAQLRGKSFTLLGHPDANAAFTVVGPAGVVVESDRPTFRWRQLDGATAYTVAIFDSRFNRVVRSDAITATEWSPPRPLKRGTVYSWQVIALKDGKEIISPAPPMAEAKFKVLDQARADDLRRARQQYPLSHLTLGVLYARAGLLDEARREFQALAEANPQSPIATKLLRSVQSLE